MIRILFIAHSSEFGGAENHLGILISQLPKDRFQCFCVFPRQGMWVEKLRALGIKTYICDLKLWVNEGFHRLHNLYHFCDGLKARADMIARIIQDEKIDLVFTNTSTVGEGALVAKMMKVPHVWHILEKLHNDPALMTPLPLKSYFYLIHTLSAWIITAADAIKRDIELELGFSSSKIQTIYNGLPPRALTPDSFRRSNNVVLGVGNICRRKGFLTLLRAAVLVQKEVPDARFRIAGPVIEEDYHQQLLKERKRLGLTETFEFIGFKENIIEEYEQSKVFVLSSLAEPFGQVVLFAMLTGRPVVATDSGGAKEAIIDGKTGFIVPIENPKAMAEKIISLLKDPRTAEEMGKKGHEHLSQNFTEQKSTDGFIALFEKLYKEPKEIPLDLTGHIPGGSLIDFLDAMGADHTDVKNMSYTNYRKHNSLVYKIYNHLKKFLKQRTPKNP